MFAGLNSLFTMHNTIFISGTEHFGIILTKCIYICIHKGEKQKGIQWGPYNKGSIALVYGNMVQCPKIFKSYCGEALHVINKLDTNETQQFL